MNETGNWKQEEANYPSKNKDASDDIKHITHFEKINTGFPKEYVS